MCKLSQNIVSNVYNSLQSSFLSLAWPWSGSSLPKGNQWEWWDPGQGPLPGLGEVGHSPKETSGSAGTLDWGPMWLGSHSTCHPQMPLHPCWTPMPLLAPEHLHSLLTSNAPPTSPAAPWHPCQWECLDPGLGPNVVWLPVHLSPPMPPTPLLAPNAPWYPNPLLAPEPLHPLLLLYPCQWECLDPSLGPNVVGIPVHLPPPNAPLRAPTPPAGPLTLSTLRGTHG